MLEVCTFCEIANMCSYIIFSCYLWILCWTL